MMLKYFFNINKVIIWNLYYFIVIFPVNIYFYLKQILGLSKFIEYNGIVDFGNKICIFAAYPTLELDQQSYGHYLSSIMDLDFSIIFVSNAKISEESVIFLKQYCTKIIIRDNWGRDFGCYKCGIKKYEEIIRNSSELLLVNDSVLGPIFDLKPIFEEMYEKKYDFWGLSEGYCEGKSLVISNAFHYPAHFLVITKKILNSKDFWKFWNKYRINSSRMKTIYLGEINFSRCMFKANFNTGCYIPTEKIFNHIKEITNNFSDLRVLEISYNHFYLNYCSEFIKIYAKNNYKRLSKFILYSPQAFLENSFKNILYSTASYGEVLYTIMLLGYPFIKKDALLERHCNIENIQQFTTYLTAELINRYSNILKSKAYYTSGLDFIIKGIGER